MSTESIKKVLYVNGGVDFAPIHVFPDAEEYIYVDTLPRAEKDAYRIKMHYYRRNFIDQIVGGLMKQGFILSSIIVLNPDYTWKIASIRQKIKHGIGKMLQMPSLELVQVNPAKYTFVNRRLNKTVKYYVNTNIKYNMDHELHNDIMYSDAVVISNSVPNSILLNYFYKPKLFVTKESGFRFVYGGSEKGGKHLLSTIQKEGGDSYFYKYLFFDDEWSNCKSFDHYHDIFL